MTTMRISSEKSGITEKTRLQQMRRNWNSRLRARRVDRQNFRLYGSQAPRFAERVWVPTVSLNCSIKAGTSKDSARVIDHWPADAAVATRELPAIAACLDHWQNGVSWEATGIFQGMLDIIENEGKVDRLRSLHDIEQRYAAVDTLYNEAASARRLSTRAELIPGNFREEGGILVHLGPDGAPFFGRKGHHRLATAIALCFEHIPAQLGVVHVSALEHLARYRR